MPSSNQVQPMLPSSEQSVHSNPRRTHYEQRQAADRVRARLQGAALSRAEEEARNRLREEAPVVLGRIQAEARHKIAMAVSAGAAGLEAPRNAGLAVSLPNSKPFRVVQPRSSWRRRSRSTVWPECPNTVAPAVATAATGSSCRSRNSSSSNRCGVCISSISSSTGCLSAAVTPDRHASAAGHTSQTAAAGGSCTWLVTADRRPLCLTEVEVDAVPQDVQTSSRQQQAWQQPVLQQQAWHNGTQLLDQLQQQQQQQYADESRHLQSGCLQHSSSSSSSGCSCNNNRQLLLRRCCCDTRDTLLLLQPLLQLPEPPDSLEQQETVATAVVSVTANYPAEITAEAAGALLGGECRSEGRDPAARSTASKQCMSPRRPTSPIAHAILHCHALVAGSMSRPVDPMMQPLLLNEL